MPTYVISTPPSANALFHNRKGGRFKTRGDCDNRIKPVLDLLVRAGILVDDRSDYVSSVSISYDDVQMCHVSVTPEAA